MQSTNGIDTKTNDVSRKYFFARKEGNQILVRVRHYMD